jgi:1-phosphofructokinase family hexose kinase
MILCLTPNPAVDRTLYVNSLSIGEVHRSEKVLVAAGGKGLNTARTIRTLGGDPLCMGPMGGKTGGLLADLAMQDGLFAQWTQVKNETRTCIILTQADQDATVINEMGQEIDTDECQSLIEDVLSQASHVNFICVCGSLPPGFSQEKFKSMLSELVVMGKHVWVDTSGAALKTALDVRGVCIKVNALELGNALGIEISNTQQTVMAMNSVRKCGISQIAVTLGEDGAVFSSDAGTWFAQPPQIKVVSSVGSGDSFLGGLLFSLHGSSSPDVALKKAVAAGAANTLEFGAGKFSYGDFASLCEHVNISALPH